MKNKPLNGFITFYAFHTEDDGICTYSSEADANKAWAKMDAAGANGMTDVEEINMNVTGLVVTQ